ncbi:alanine racemase [Pasteurellaceae bacterium HPA106]|uniref:alanine racemase n=1 Tax=Spirabiliibacterium pneumoniae TaxID=221400 RepID=UPI001AAC9C5D|nr:alanine racemase [Spirabiliibacterium pneumoniae]MBE2897109.1 alanine racemase [Spirabiliibacterium pneumoniae]
MKTIHGAKATVSLAVLRDNFSKIKQLAPKSQCLAIVKANAYGHGMLAVAQALHSQADGFGVAHLKEAAILRHHGIEKPILLLEGFFNAQDVPYLQEYALEPVLHSEYQIQAIEQTALCGRLKVWIKIDTGMHRLGFAPDEVNAIYARLASSGKVGEIGFVSHFSRADERQSDYTLTQITRFEQAIGNLSGPRSLSASNGILFWPQAHYDAVRPGIILYGIAPDDQVKTAQAFDLRCAMELSSNIIALRRHKAGEPVGYGGRWVSARDTTIAVVAMGYGDGFPRDVPEKTPVLINGKRYPIVGKVSMDMLTVDLGDDSAEIGDEVIFWGADLPVEEIAQHLGVISYELVTQLSSRVSREYI